MSSPRLLDLFSGFGGFALAAFWVWPDLEIHSFVESDPFCQQWLKANFPWVLIHPNAKDYKHDGTEIDILQGGPPCQPVSVAGKRKGDSDDRWLWPAMLRIIQDVQPRWIVFENVAGLVNFGGGLLFDGILTDMEAAGYETTAFILPACSQDAPHRRERVFIVAHSIGKYGDGAGSCASDVCRERSEQTEISRSEDVADTSQELYDRSGNAGQGWWREFTNGGFWQDAAWITGHDGKTRRIKPGIRLLVNGFPHRNDLLRGFGNAIVPQAVFPIFQAIKKIDERRPDGL